MDRFFEVIVAEHQNTVFGLLFSLVRDRQLAEDLTQEVFLVFLRKIDLIDVSRPILPWLLRTARNLAANAKRRRALEQSLFVSGDEAIRFWEHLGGPTLGSDWDERLGALQDCREKLPASQKDVVDMFYNEGHGAREIAETLDTAVAAIHNRLSRGRRALHDCIQRKIRRAEAV